MRTTWTLLAASMLCMGCASTQPLAAIPEARQCATFVEFETNSNSRIFFSTAKGRNAEQAGHQGGLIGMLIGSNVSAGEESKGCDFVGQLRSRTGEFEAQALISAVKSRLGDAGFNVSDKTPESSELKLSIESVGLQEVQRGFWVAWLGARAKLRTSDKTLKWSAVASSTGIAMRDLDEFVTNPQLYVMDMDVVVDDIARQLVNGPIRR